MRVKQGFVSAGAVAALGIVVSGCGPTAATSEFASQSLAANKELTAPSELTANLRGTATNTKTSTTFAVKKNGVGGVDVNVAGKSMSFSGADVAGATWRKPGDPFQKAGVLPDIATGDVINGNHKKYAQVWQYFHGTGGETNQGFAVVGNATPGASLPTNTTVNYSGAAGVVLAPPAGNGRATVQYGSAAAKAANPASEARLSANFTNRTISGQFSGGLLTGTDNTGETVIAAPSAAGGSLTLNTAAITGEGKYTGTVSGNISNAFIGGNVALNATSAYSGQFFGPAAEETAGVLNLDLAGGIIGVGAYHADKQ